jgi:tetratricopeptide (TPR) repeat protein
MKQAAWLVDRTLAENRFAGAEGRQLLNSMIYLTVMLEPRIPVGPKRWLPMLLDLVVAPAIRRSLIRPLPTGDVFSGLPPTATHDEMMFIIRATALKSVEELVELIDALEEQPKSVRDRYLGASARTNQSLHFTVAASWRSDVKRPGFDARAVAATFHRLGQTKSARDNPSLAVELLCAEAIILDDYGDDKDGALEVLRIAQQDHPNDYRINRQRQKVFYRHSQHAEALAEFETFEDRLPKERVVDRAYALREAGRSAAETGDLQRARVFFEQAWESARVCGDSMTPMAAGLLADCAILDYDAGKKESALDCMRRALLEADELDPGSGLKEAFVKRIHIAAILYMRGRAADSPFRRQAMFYGVCSNPEPQEWFREQPQAQPTFVWYQLAELEAEISQGQTVLNELRARTKVIGGLLPLESMLATTITVGAIQALDVDRFVESLKIYPRAVVEHVNNRELWGGDPFNMHEGTLAPISEGEWKGANIAQCTKYAVMSFMLAGAARGRADLLTDLRHKVARVPGLTVEVENLFGSMDDPSDGEKDIYVIIPSIAGRLLSDYVFDANDVFLSGIYILQLLEASVLAPAVAEALMSFYERIWPEILEHRSFCMSSPRTNGPIILSAMKRGDTALQRMANMVLATEAAAKRRLSNELRERLAKISARRSKSVAMSED